MKICFSLLVALFFFLTGAPDPASSMEKKLQHIEANGTRVHPDSSPTDLSEQEINAYFASGKIQMPDGVQSVRFTGLEGTITALARVDLDKIRASRRTCPTVRSRCSCGYTCRSRKCSNTGGDCRRWSA